MYFDVMIIKYKINRYFEYLELRSNIIKFDLTTLNLKKSSSTYEIK